MGFNSGFKGLNIMRGRVRKYLEKCFAFFTVVVLPVLLIVHTVICGPMD